MTKNSKSRPDGPPLGAGSPSRRSARHSEPHDHDHDTEHGYDADEGQPADKDGLEDQRAEGRSQTFVPGRKLSKDDLQDLAKMSSDLVRRTLLSGIDIVRDVGKELPKEATQFLAARREQVLQNVSKDVIQMLINASIDRLFKTVREHRVEVSFRIVRDVPKGEDRGASHRERGSRSKSRSAE